MTATSDMATPMTRGELREELKCLEERFEHKLDLWGGALRAHLDSSNRALLARIESGEQRLLGELARHAMAIQESVLAQISAIDEKYADLPTRVKQIEI